LVLKVSLYLHLLFQKQIYASNYASKKAILIIIHDDDFDYIKFAKSN